MNKTHTLQQIIKTKDNDLRKIYVTDDFIVQVTNLNISKKVEIVQDIVLACAYDGVPYVNPIKVKVYGAIKVLEESTDIDIQNSEIEDIYEIYDILEKADIINKVLPITDYYEIINWAIECVEHAKAYQNSIVGVLEELKNSFNSEELLNVMSSVKAELNENPELKSLLNLYSEEQEQAVESK